jgi:regulator of ribosome biosynthesis
MSTKEKIERKHRLTLNNQPLPPAQGQTTWQRFAAKKGIKPKTAAARQNLQFNEATGEWERKWGYKGANKAAEQQWIVEVDERKEREGKEGKAALGGRQERKERVRRNERAMRRNEKRAGKKG